ncbi:Zinc finger MYM-type protein 1 [Linum grandiflorum]
MKRYFSSIVKTTSPVEKETESIGNKQPTTSSVNQSRQEPQSAGEHQSKSPSLSDEWKINGVSLQADPGLRQKLSIYNSNVRDEIRRAYLLKGPYQPRAHRFPYRQYGERRRRFMPSWFDQYKWLEYSTAEDAAYYLDCYLFRHEVGNKSGGDKFIGKGFTNWSKPSKLEKHVGEFNSLHNDCRRMSEALMQQSQSIQIALDKQSDKTKKDYRIRLEASVKCISWLLKHGLPFRGHDESEDSNNRGLFLSLLEFYASDIEKVKSVVLNNAPKNHQLTSLKNQKDIVHALAVETSKLITMDIGDDLFTILADESRDVSVKEQMSVVLRYVNGNGCVMERFLGISHVSDTKAVSLKTQLNQYLLSMD